MKSLVTGGLGFVGSNLVDKLVELGDEVWVIDNLSSISSSMKYQNKGAKYILSDIEKILDIELLRDQYFDRIFHLAADSRIQPSFDRPFDYFKSNMWGTAVVMEYARLTGSKMVIYSTTSSKNHGSHYITPYTFTKVAGEGILKTYSECFGLNTASCTFFNVYGPREPEIGEWATVVAKFGRQWRCGEPLTIVGDGNQTRDFTHVYDICEGLIKVSLGDWKGENFDLGRGEPISILDMAKLWSENIMFVPERKGEGKHTKCDYSETQDKCGWIPRRSLVDWILQSKKTTQV